MNYYKILNIEKNASLDEINTAYKTLIRKNHPDKFSDPEKKKEAEKVFQEITAAYNVLKDTEKRKAYEKSLDENLTSKSDINKNQASQYFKNGLHQLNNENNYKMAEEFFKKAVYLDKENSKYYYYLGLAQASNGKKMREAVENLEKAFSLEPYDPKYPNKIGQIYLSAKMETRAVKYFQKALALDAENKEAIEGLRALGIGKKRSFLDKLFGRK